VVEHEDWKLSSEDREFAVSALPGIAEASPVQIFSEETRFPIVA
jgi:hypothetical protein